MSSSIYRSIQGQCHVAVTTYQVCTYPDLMHELHLLRFMTMRERGGFFFKNLKFKTHYSSKSGQGLVLRCNIPTVQLLQLSQGTFRHAEQ